jgi:hypothetical protein
MLMEMSLGNTAMLATIGNIQVCPAGTFVAFESPIVSVAWQVLATGDQALNCKKTWDVPSPGYPAIQGPLIVLGGTLIVIGSPPPKRAESGPEIVAVAVSEAFPVLSIVGRKLALLFSVPA